MAIIIKEGTDDADKGQQSTLKIDKESRDTPHFLDGKGGNDNIKGSKAADVIYGGAGNDNIRAGRGADLVYGGAGDDQPDLEPAAATPNSQGRSR